MTSFIAGAAAGGPPGLHPPFRVGQRVAFVAAMISPATMR
jgi:hypothetical protein